LVTVKDAADGLTDRFSTVTAWGALEICIEQLMQAATTGKRVDITEATDVLQRVLRAARDVRRCGQSAFRGSAPTSRYLNPTKRKMTTSSGTATPNTKAAIVTSLFIGLWPMTCELPRG
jgi:hypothetical protein